MLNANQSAEYYSFKFENQVVRVHKHTDNGSLWFVLKDILKCLGITNTSYVSHKIENKNIIKHLITLPSNKHYTVTWVNSDAVYTLFDYISTLKSKTLRAWIDTDITPIFNKPHQNLSYQSYIQTTDFN